MISLTGAVILPFSLILYHGFVKTIPGERDIRRCLLYQKRASVMKERTKQWL